MTHKQSFDKAPHTSPQRPFAPDGHLAAGRGGSIPGAEAPACTVYYDGDCPVCRREIAHYRSRRGAAAIVWVDAASCDERELGPGLDRRAALQRFHVRDAEGTLASGAAAFVAIWRRLPAFAWLAPLAASRPMLALLDAGYALFLRIRSAWRPAATTRLP